MSEDRDILGGDDKEPYRHGANHMNLISRSEFQNLVIDVKDVQAKVSDLCGDMKIVKGYIETQEKKLESHERQFNRRLAVVSVVITIIAVVVGVVVRYV